MVRRGILSSPHTCRDLPRTASCGARGARLLWACGLVFVVSACSTDASEPVSGDSPAPDETMRATAAELGASAESVRSAEPEPETFAPRSDSPGVPDDSTQAIVVTTADWKAPEGELVRFERQHARAPWSRALAERVAVSVGRYGLAWGRGLHPEDMPGPVKFEGDHRSPAGVFDLGEVRGYEKAPPEGTTWPFLHSGTHFRCIDNPRSQAYNSFMPTNGLPLPPSVGIASREKVFAYMLFVMHNTSPVVRGGGSCVFLHVWAKPGHPTQGCIGMARKSIEALIPWLDLDRRPVLVQLPRDVYDGLQQSWTLPIMTPAG